jgi:hypothetical protein
LRHYWAGTAKFRAWDFSSGLDRLSLSLKSMQSSNPYEYDFPPQTPLYLYNQHSVPAPPSIYIPPTASFSSYGNNRQAGSNNPTPATASATQSSSGNMTSPELNGSSLPANSGRDNPEYDPDDDLSNYNLPTIPSTSRQWGKYDFVLEVAQDPIRARMCGFGDKVDRPAADRARPSKLTCTHQDRRPITPPVIVRLRVFEAATQRELDYE